MSTSYNSSVFRHLLLLNIPSFIMGGRELMLFFLFPSCFSLAIWVSCISLQRLLVAYCLEERGWLSGELMNIQWLHYVNVQLGLWIIQPLFPPLSWFFYCSVSVMYPMLRPFPSWNFYQSCYSLLLISLSEVITSHFYLRKKVTWSSFVLFSMHIHVQNELGYCYSTKHPAVGSIHKPKSCNPHEYVN